MQSVFGVAASALTASEHNGFFFYSRSGGDLTRLELKFDVRVPVFTLETDSGASVWLPLASAGWLLAGPLKERRRARKIKGRSRAMFYSVALRSRPRLRLKKMSDLRFVYSPRRTN